MAGGVKLTGSSMIWDHCKPTACGGLCGQRWARALGHRERLCNESRHACSPVELCSCVRVLSAHHTCANEADEEHLTTQRSFHCCWYFYFAGGDRGLFDVRRTLQKVIPAARSAALAKISAVRSGCVCIPARELTLSCRGRWLPEQVDGAEHDALVPEARFASEASKHDKSRSLPAKRMIIDSQEQASRNNPFDALTTPRSVPTNKKRFRRKRGGFTHRSLRRVNWYRVFGSLRAPCGASGTRYVLMRGLIGSRRVPST